MKCYYLDQEKLKEILTDIIYSEDGHLQTDEEMIERIEYHIDYYFGLGYMDGESRGEMNARF